MDLLSTTEDFPLCNSMPRDLLSARERLGLEREEKATARLQRGRERDRERRRSERAEVRQAKLDRQRVRDYERRAAEQPEARQARLDTERKRTHERKAAEQPEARQARLDTERERTHSWPFEAQHYHPLLTQLSPHTMPWGSESDIPAYHTLS